MPVLSPHRSGSSASTLPNYRSSYTSSSLVDRPYHHYGTTASSSVSSSYVPRYNSSSYENRYYTDTSSANGSATGHGSRRTYMSSRASSILEDSGTSGYHREECREVSVTRRGTLGGDTTLHSTQSTTTTERISSIRENSILDSYQPRMGGSREGSRDRGMTTASVAESVADFRNKYSPSNYVPKVIRTRQANGIGLERDSMSRSKTLGDIGLPPVKITSVSSAIAAAPPTTNSTNTNTSEDDENRSMRSVTEIRRHFDRLSQSQERELSPTISGNNKNRGLVKAGRESTTATSVNGFEEPGLLTNGHNHTTDFASYISASTSEQPQKSSSASNGEITDRGTKEEVEASCNREVNGTVGDAVALQPPGDHQMMDRRFHHHPKTNPANEISSRNATSTATPITTTTTSGRPSPELTSGAIAGGATTNLGTYTSARNATTATSLSASAPGAGSGLNGLKNIGNTCFMNSVLQCLSNTRPLLEYMKKDGYSGDINTTISGMKGALVKAFAQLIRDLWSDECVVNTSTLKSQIQRFAPRFMGYSQQDAQEFLRYLLEGLHEDVNRVIMKPTPLTQDIDDRLPDGEKAQEAWQRYTRMDNSKIVDLFVGQLKSTLKCTHCGHCSVTFDPFWDLSLPLPPRTGQLRLSQCLDSFTREETLDGDEKPTCSKCKERRKCTKSFSIQRFPKILVIHLKRFSPMERFRGKLSCTVDFPLEGLDMSNYAGDSKTSQCRYNLYAISNHSGTTYSGHYTAYCKHPYTGAWHEYNDSRVSTISARSLVSGEAYVLFYELDSGSQRAHL